MVALVITLIIAGLLLLAAELVIIPGFGIAGILGIASLAGSCWLAFSSIGTGAGIAVLITDIALVIITTILVLRSRTWKKLSLETNINARTGESPAARGIAVADSGIALTRLAPGGKGEINGKEVEVFTRDRLIEAGSGIRVTEIDGYKIYVDKTE